MPPKAPPAIDSSRKQFVVGFKLHEAKKLSKNGVAVDPLCVVRLLGREYKTDLKRGKLHHVKFTDEYIWSDIRLTEEEFNGAFIDFELQAANVWTRNDIIGTARVQLAMVRRRPNRTTGKKWLQLSNSVQTSAQLKVTVFCYGQGEDPPRPEDMENDAEETNKHMEALNNAIVSDGAGMNLEDGQAYHLIVHVHRAEHLGGGEQRFNPYVAVEFNGHKLESPAAKDAHTLTFDECFRLPVVMPVMADSIMIRVWDKKGRLMQDGIIVSGRLSFSVLRMHALQPKWFNFYGFSSKEVKDVHALTSQGEPAEENVYMGRLLISARVQKVAHPSDLMKAGMMKGQVAEEPPASHITFALDVMEISGCPGMEAYAEISIGTKSKSSKPAKRADFDESPDFNEPGRFRYTPGEGRVSPLQVLMPTDAANQLDVILSIYAQLKEGITSKLERVGFVRMKVRHVKEWRGETSAPFWVACKPMAHLPSSVEPGSLLISLARSSSQIQNRGVANVRPLQFELRCYIFMARDLVSQSREVPSPFVQVSCAGSLAKTETIAHTTAPSWGALLKVPIELQCSLETQRVQPEPIQIAVYDELETVLTGLAENATQALKEGDAAYLNANMNKLGALGAEAFTNLQDRIGDMTGDVLAKKRLGAIKNGRRVIGRAQVHIRNILRPGVPNGDFMPRWLRLKGGMLGQAAVGDVLLGFELMKKKYVDDIPVQPTTPQCKTCTVSVSILGLRDLEPIQGRSVQNPKLQVVVPSLSGGKATIHTIAWTQRPMVQLTPEDLNDRWKTDGKSGFQFMNVIHLDTVLPRFAVWEPNIRLRLLDGDMQDAFLAEGRVSLVEHIPWIKPGRGKKAVEAQDDFDGGLRGKDEGVPVSDAEDEGRASYITIEVKEGPLDVGFVQADTKSFPPIVSVLPARCQARDEGVKRGDWLVGIRTPTDEEEQCVARWSPAQAAKWSVEADKRKVRPLTMRFRRTDKAEVFVRLAQGVATGVELVQDVNAKPPKINKDVSENKIWKKQGIGNGWRIIDINGFDTKNMNSKDPLFTQLLEGRPAIITCRPHGVALGVDEEQNLQMKNPVLLSGIPTRVLLEYNHKMKHKDGCMALTTVPRPSLLLPDVTSSKQLNLYTARGHCMDVRGVIRHVSKGEEEEDDTRTRPSVAGRLEENMEPCLFTSVPLRNGLKEVGKLKVAYRVIYPSDKEWVSKLKDPNSLDRSLFDERLFRKKYKLDQPPIFRVRTYIIRGLNVSGAHHGYGNPYLFFRYGEDTVWLDGHKQMNTVEPRFFKTEERDVLLPSQAQFEVGLNDWQDHGDDQNIGRTIIDLEDRWFTPTFQTYMKQKKVPVEYRPVEQEMETGSHLCKGSLEMWVEIIDAAQAAEIPASALVQPHAVEVEIRAVVYAVRNLSLRLCVNEETGEEREKITIRVKCALEGRTFTGKQPAIQETDLHHSSEGTGEFNWRFVWSRVAVTQGVPLDCLLQFSVWEVFDLSEPKMLCENLLDMRNYCKKVAKHSEELQMEAELPLQNSQLSQLLSKEMHPEDNYEEDDDEDSQGGDDEQAPLQPEKGEKQEKDIPPAALITVMVQVFPQTQASSADMVVGLGRSEPNRLPVLSFPKTGRNWEDILPGTAKVIHEIIESVGTFRRRCAIVSIFVGTLLVIGLLHYIKNPLTGCPYIQKSCKSAAVCERCNCCHNQDKAPVTFCFYPFVGSGESVCTRAQYKDLCNMNEGTCALPEGGCDQCGGQICFMEPNDQNGHNRCRGRRLQNESALAF